MFIRCMLQYHDMAMNGVSTRQKSSMFTSWMFHCIWSTERRRLKGSWIPNFLYVRRYYQHTNWPDLSSFHLPANPWCLPTSIHTWNGRFAWCGIPTPYSRAVNYAVLSRTYDDGAATTSRAALINQEPTLVLSCGKYSVGLENDILLLVYKRIAHHRIFHRRTLHLRNSIFCQKLGFIEKTMLKLTP